MVSEGGFGFLVPMACMCCSGNSSPLPFQPKACMCFGGTSPPFPSPSPPCPPPHTPTPHNSLHSNHTWSCQSTRHNSRHCQHTHRIKQHKHPLPTPPPKHTPEVVGPLDIVPGIIHPHWQVLAGRGGGVDLRRATAAAAATAMREESRPWTNGVLMNTGCDGLSSLAAADLRCEAAQRMRVMHAT